MPTATATKTALTISEAAVLALLALEDAELSPYDLMKRVSKAIGHVWAPAKTQLYAVLPRLEAAKLTRSRTTREGNRPEKQLYRLTTEGRRALDAWLEEEPTSIDTFYLKLFVGNLAPRETTLRHLDWLRANVAAQLDTYRELERTNSRTGPDRFHWYLLSLGTERAEHLLAWADRVEADLKRRR